MTHSKQSIFALALAACVLVSNTTTASAAKFTMSKSPEGVSLLGGNQTFGVGTFVIKCTTTTGESAKISFPTEQMVFSHNLTGCVANGLGSVTITCAPWDFHSTGTVTGGADGGGTITWGACSMVIPSICTITTPVQTLSGVTYSNSAGRLPVKMVLSHIGYTASAGCIGFSKSGANMDYVGELTAKSISGTDNLGIA